MMEKIHKEPGSCFIFLLLINLLAAVHCSSKRFHIFFTHQIWWERGSISLMNPSKLAMHGWWRKYWPEIVSTASMKTSSKLNSLLSELESFWISFERYHHCCALYVIKKKFLDSTPLSHEIHSTIQSWSHQIQILDTLQLGLGLGLRLSLL